jgi:hypothetical protein
MVSRKTTFAGLAIASTLIFPSGAVGAPQATGSTTAGASQTGSLIATLPTAAPETWMHPGVFASVPQLMFVRHRVKAGAQPWSQAFTDMLANPLASANRTAIPRADVDCGGGSIPDNGCSDERDDAMAAYMNALAYWFTDNTAEKAIYYMNAWSRTIQIHTSANKDLQARWAAAEWVRAGEFILHSAVSHLWAAADVEAFRNMLRTAYIPAIINGQTVNDGNQELGMLRTLRKDLRDNNMMMVSNDGIRDRSCSIPRRRICLGEGDVLILRTRSTIHLPHIRRTITRPLPRYQTGPRIHH